MREFHVYKKVVFQRGVGEDILYVARRHSLRRLPMSKKKDTGGTASDMELIPQEITLKNDQFDKFIEITESSESQNPDLVSLLYAILDKPPKSFRLDEKGIFVEEKPQCKHNFKECIENADKGYLVSFFAEEATLLSQKIALSEGLSVESPYVLLRNGKRISISDADDLESKVTWIEYFQTHNDPKGLEKFLEDREQDIPRDIYL